MPRANRPCSSLSGRVAQAHTRAWAQAQLQWRSKWYERVISTIWRFGLIINPCILCMCRHCTTHSGHFMGSTWKNVLYQSGVCSPWCACRFPLRFFFPISIIIKKRINSRNVNPLHCFDQHDFINKWNLLLLLLLLLVYRYLASALNTMQCMDIAPSFYSSPKYLSLL